MSSFRHASRRVRHSLGPKAFLLLIAGLSVFVLTFLPGCGGGGGGGGGNAGGNGGGNQLSSVSGVLKSQVTGQPLAGITVAVLGTNLSDVSGNDGSFAIANVPTGQQTFDFSDALGNPEASQSLAIAGANDNLGTLTLNIEGNPPNQPGI